LENPNMTRLLVAGLLGLLMSLSALADTVQVAVASNFGGAMQQIAPAFHQATGHELKVTTAGTGKLYAQIRNGAPFEVLLSADDKTPKKLEAEGLAVPGTRFTYALGKLVLWSARPGMVDREGKILRQGDFAHISLGNPRTVPYGEAAAEVLRHLGLYEALEPRFVLGENVAQAQQFVASGNAELGFVAQSGVYRDGQLTGGSAWWVPAHLHSPIRQDAVLLKPGRDNAAARALLDYLRTAPARAIMTSLGYGFE
jgi:molybdate transport system substrate-binding protein